MNHWMILPILLPAIVAPLLALAVRHDIVLARVFSVGSAVSLVLIGFLQLGMAADGETRIYALGDWPPPFGIVLVLDRLSALMLVLTAVLGLAVLLYAINGCDRRGAHFHPLFQFQLMGLNGAFLTGDLFNLFVFFEVLLIASYGLMVHGGGAARLRAGIQYVVVNLVGSTLFLFALGLIYGVTGTLNMADLAVKVPEVSPGDRPLLYAGGSLLLVVFGIKSAAVPLQFWLPGTYANASGPVAALFSVMTKVGAYAILRVFVLAFGETAGEDAWFAARWLVPAAYATLVVGMVGVLASRSLGQQASFAALGSMGTLLIAVAGFTPESGSAALYYLVHSTLSIAALFLIVDAVIIRRPGFGDALTASPRFAHDGLIGSMYFVAAIAVIGMPPLSGFVGKLLILDALRGTAGWGWGWAAILGTSMLALVGFAAGGSVLFWKGGAVEGRLETSSRHPIVLPMVATGALLVMLVGVTGFGGPLTRYFDDTAAQLFEPSGYIEAVLGGEEALAKKGWRTKRCWVMGRVRATKGGKGNDWGGCRSRSRKGQGVLATLVAAPVFDVGARRLMDGIAEQLWAGWTFGGDRFGDLDSDLHRPFLAAAAEDPASVAGAEFLGRVVGRYRDRESAGRVLDRVSACGCASESMGGGPVGRGEPGGDHGVGGDDHVDTGDGRERLVGRRADVAGALLGRRGRKGDGPSDQDTLRTQDRVVPTMIEVVR